MAPNSLWTYNSIDTPIYQYGILHKDTPIYMLPLYIDPYTFLRYNTDEEKRCPEKGIPNLEERRCADGR